MNWLFSQAQSLVQPEGNSVPLEADSATVESGTRRQRDPLEGRSGRAGASSMGTQSLRLHGGVCREGKD